MRKDLRLLPRPISSRAIGALLGGQAVTISSRPVICSVKCAGPAVEFDVVGKQAGTFYAQAFGFRAQVVAALQDIAELGFKRSRAARSERRAFFETRQIGAQGGMLFGQLVPLRLAVLRIQRATVPAPALPRSARLLFLPTVGRCVRAAPLRAQLPASVAAIPGERRRGASRPARTLRPACGVRDRTPGLLFRDAAECRADCSRSSVRLAMSRSSPSNSAVVCSTACCLALTSPINSRNSRLRPSGPLLVFLPPLTAWP